MRFIIHSWVYQKSSPIDASREDMYIIIARENFFEISLNTILQH